MVRVHPLGHRVVGDHSGGGMMATISTASATASTAPLSAIRATLDATVPKLCATLRAAPSGAVPIKGMRWRVGELAAHIAETAVVFTQAARGEVTAYGERGEFNAEV